ncbi:hypothetical protein JHK82_050469 [Glycine max]|nr:hypothetical protein JHK82_050469 [Glycine max]
MSPITFTSNDFKAIDPVQDNLVVMSVEITNFIVRKTLVGQHLFARLLVTDVFQCGFLC